MRTLALGICVAALAAMPAAAQQANPRYSSLVVFGDSLVDAGNIRAVGLGADPAEGYFMGRFTNGYDYTDIISQRLFGGPTVASLLGGTNFAFGGARATTTSFVPDLNEQFASYAGYIAGAPDVDPTGLYVLNFGGNDIFAAAQPGTPIGYTTDSAFLMDAARTYAQGVQTLADLGVRNILLTGFPNATPGPQLTFSLEAEGYLTDALAALDLTGDTTLYRFSYLSFFQRLQANPTAFGLPADLILPDPTRPDGGTCQGAMAGPGCTGFFSFDGVHPTAAIHRAIAQDLNVQFGLTSVPEPASWAMMIGGFGMVGGMLRHRRRSTRLAFG